MPTNGLAQVVFATPSYEVNVTMLLSVITVCLTALTVAVRVFGRKPEEEPGKSPWCVQHKASYENLTKKSEEHTQKLSSIENRITTLEVETKNTHREVTEIKEESRKLASKMDDLLSQILDLLN